MSLSHGEGPGAIPGGSTKARVVFNSSTSGFHPDSPGATPGPRSTLLIWADGLVTCRVSKTPRLGAIPGAHAITANPSRIGSSPAKLNVAYKRLVEAQEDSVQLRGPGPFPSRLVWQTRCASPATSHEVARDDRAWMVRSGQLSCRNGQPAAGLIRRSFSVQLGVLHPTERSLEARHSAWDRVHAGASPAVPTTFDCGVV